MVSDYRAPAGEEVYSFRQVTEYPGFTPQTLAAINTAIKAWAVWQKKQSLQKPAKYAAVHESRTAEDRRTAAELAARLTKLRNEHADSAAQVASEVSQPSGGDGDQIGPETAEHVVKEKKPWPAKVCDQPICDNICSGTICGVLPPGQRCSLQMTMQVSKHALRNTGFVQVVLHNA